MSSRTGKGKKRKPKGSPDNPEQSRRFIESAKKLGVDESGEDFQKAMDALLKPKPKRGSS
jgi:hypothetical protein